MTRSAIHLSAIALALLVVVTGAVSAETPAKRAPKSELSFGSLQAASAETARTEALNWLKQTGKADTATLKAFDTVWSKNQRPVLDRVADTLAMTDRAAKDLLDEARDQTKPAPTTVPAILKDSKKPAFYRANLGLAYGKALSNRRVYEEALAALKLVKVEQVVDPSSYLFHRAVSEHALLLKEDANRSIIRLLDDVSDAPDRHKLVAILMAFDMQSWKEKDLAEIARKMDNIERRLELARGGAQTQKIQKDVLARLDEIIKQLENQAKGEGNGGGCPNGGSGGNGGPNPSSPQLDSYGGRNGGPGQVTQKRLEEIAKGWGKLPEKEKAKAMQELTRGMSSKYRELTEKYLTDLSRKAANDSAK